MTTRQSTSTRATGTCTCISSKRSSPLRFCPRLKQLLHSGGSWYVTDIDDTSSGLCSSPDDDRLGGNGCARTPVDCTSWTYKDWGVFDDDYINEPNVVVGLVSGAKGLASAWQLTATALAISITVGHCFG